jgi:predicted dehydrogenase
MIKIGIAGIGFIGWIHYLAYQKVRGAKVTAFCEQIPKRQKGDWRDIKGNFGPPGELVDVSQMQVYSDLDALVADPDVDVVDVCLPPGLHADVTIKALKAGKHVFCEKPMALTTAECRRMVAAAEKSGKQMFIAHVLPYFPEYLHARKLIDSGRYGKLLGGNFKRVISDPLWLKDFYDPVRVGGPMLDLHVHDAHLIRLLYGMPTQVNSVGRMRGDVVEYFDTVFRFADPEVVVRATSGVINQQGRVFTHGFEIHLEKATLHFEFAGFADGPELMPLKVLTSNGKVVRPKLGDGDPVRGFEGEIKEVLRCVKSGQPSSVLSGELARDAVVLGHKQTESVRKGRPVKV